MPPEFPHSVEYCRRRAAAMRLAWGHARTDHLRALYAVMAEQWDDLASHAERLRWDRLFD